VNIQQPKVTFTPTAIEDLLVIETRHFEDKRGWLTESFNAQDFSLAIGSDVQFVQDNHSFSKRDVLRGLHYQIDKPQGKLVRVVSGSVFDVSVDLRKNSKTYGKWAGIVLSAENHKQLWIPSGFAHGVLVLSEAAEVLYKTTNYYHPQSEVCLAWNDPSIGIEWPLPVGITPNINAKDLAGLSWEKAPKF
jgi:dTDP-4-dehydrorhamnose 3,5-epimerase